MRILCCPGTERRQTGYRRGTRLRRRIRVRGGPEECGAITAIRILITRNTMGSVLNADVSTRRRREKNAMRICMTGLGTAILTAKRGAAGDSRSGTIRSFGKCLEGRRASRSKENGGEQRKRISDLQHHRFRGGVRGPGLRYRSQYLYGRGFRGTVGRHAASDCA